jgi:hypothetical protein
MSPEALGLDFLAKNIPHSLIVWGNLLISAARVAAAALLLAGFNSAAGLADPSRKVAVFEFELIDTSLEGEKRGADPAEAARLRKASDALRDGLAATGRYAVVSTAPASGKIAEAGHIRTCNGCELRIARELGADLAITGNVQKVSTLILSINLVVKDAATGALVQDVTADIRGNTDESWLHGVRWLIRNRLARK